MPRIKYFLLVSTILFLFALLAGCGFNRPYINFKEIDVAKPAKAVAEGGNQPLRLAVSPILPQKETIRHYRQIAEHISIQTGIPTELIQRQSNAEVHVLLANGGADIALFSTGTYVENGGASEYEPLVMQQRNQAPYYYSYIIVPKESDAAVLSDLRGKTFAFTDPMSFSGHTMTEYMLKQMGESPEKFFSHYLYTFNHTKSLWAVANKAVDGASIDSLAYEYAKAKIPELAEGVRIIAVSSPIGTGPIVVRKGMSEHRKEVLRSVLLNMHYNADMKEVLKGLMIDRFVQPMPELYDYPARIVSEVRTQR